jgi:hypothetical protein
MKRLWVFRAVAIGAESYLYRRTGAALRAPPAPAPGVPSQQGGRPAIAVRFDHV